MWFDVQHTQHQKQKQGPSLGLLVAPSSAAARVASKTATGDKTSRIRRVGRQVLEKLTKENSTM